MTAAVEAKAAHLKGHQAALHATLQGGLDNDELLLAWQRKLPGTEPKGQELAAFAVGIEVGFVRARDLERQEWDRVHHVLAKHGKHPGRTDDHLADVIDRALAAHAWFFCQQSLSGDFLAIDPDGREHIVADGIMDSEAGRALINSMIRALSASAK